MRNSFWIFDIDLLVVVKKQKKKTPKIKNLSIISLHQKKFLENVTEKSPLRKRFFLQKRILRLAKVLEKKNLRKRLYFAQQAAEKAAKTLLTIYGKFTPAHVISELLIEIASQLPEKEKKQIEN